MKKNIYSLLLCLLALAGIITSCSDDKDLPKITIDETLEYSVKATDTLWLRPEVTSVLEAKYAWIIDNKEISTEKDFPFVAKTKGDYSVKFVCSNTDGKTEKVFEINVDSPFCNCTYIITEGIGSKNGQVGIIDEDGKFISEAYYKANGNYVGKYLQDMYIHNGDIYLLCQEGSDNGGDGYLVVADAETLKKKRIINYGGIEADVIWPQHLVVINDSKAYIQYSTSDNEKNSGIKVLDLISGTLSSDDIAGTYGEFAKAGASKMRMLYTNGKVFAPCGHSLSVIDTETDEIIKNIGFSGQVKDIVKGKDGNLWLAVTGEYTVNGMWMPPTIKSDSKIVGLNPSTYELVKEYTLTSDLTASLVEKNPFISAFNLSPTPAYPNIGMSASYTEDAIFLKPTFDEAYGSYDTYKFNYKTGSIEQFVSARDNRGMGQMYGYCGVDKKDNLFIGFTASKGTYFAVFDAKTGKRKDLTYLEMNLDDKDDEKDDFFFMPSRFPSGVDFTSRFNQ